MKEVTMKDKVLLPEQMKHLRELGVDTSKASMYWARKAHGFRMNDESKGKWFLSLQKDFMHCGFISYETVPTLTLQELVNLLPEEYEGRELVMRPRSAYVGYDDTSWYKNRGYLLTSAYELLCEILEDQKK